MQSPNSSNQAISTSDTVGLVLSALALTFVALYPAFWAFARPLMLWRMFGSAVTFGTPFAILVLFAPLLLAWRFIHRDKLHASDDLYDVSVR